MHAPLPLVTWIRTFHHDYNIIAIALLTTLKCHVIKKTSDLDWAAASPQQCCNVQQCCRQLLPDTLLPRVWPPLEVDSIIIEIG